MGMVITAAGTVAITGVGAGVIGAGVAAGIMAGAGVIGVGIAAAGTIAAAIGVAATGKGSAFALKPHRDLPGQKGQHQFVEP
jgi:hypothetical protein